MNNILNTLFRYIFSVSKQKGFTLIEVMVTIAIVAILATIALPNMSTFLVKMRVDNEISELQRLLLTARNMAINTGKNTTVCPLSGSNCTNNWQNEISVFTNSDNTPTTNIVFTAPDELIKTKGEIKVGDQLQYAQNSIIYTPDGRLLAVPANFSYCPKDKADLSRGISISLSGRSYTSADNDSDGKDEDRAGSPIVCS